MSAITSRHVACRPRAGLGAYAPFLRRPMPPASESVQRAGGNSWKGWIAPVRSCHRAWAALSAVSAGCHSRAGAHADRTVLALLPRPTCDQSLTGPGQRVRRRLLPGTRSAQCPGPARPHAASHPEVHTPAISLRAVRVGNHFVPRRVTVAHLPWTLRRPRPVKASVSPPVPLVRKTYPASKLTGRDTVGPMLAGQVHAGLTRVLAADVRVLLADMAATT